MLVLFVFFFFKQKTAYELRISDWISDVCSSDLEALAERLKISESAARLAEEKALALATVNSQNALLHASGHDSKQVILALNSAAGVLRQSEDGVHRELGRMLESSAAYLGGIVSTTISGANMAASESAFLALGSFPAEALTEPLMMMFKIGRAP